MGSVKKNDIELLLFYSNLKCQVDYKRTIEIEKFAAWIFLKKRAEGKLIFLRENAQDFTYFVIIFDLKKRKKNFDLNILHWKATTGFKKFAQKRTFLFIIKIFKRLKGFFIFEKSKKEKQIYN